MTAQLPIQSANSDDGGEPNLVRSRLRRLWSHPYGKAFAVVAVALLLSKIAFSLHLRTVGAIIAVALTALIGWAFFGHIVTIDDDMPGEWSNPGRSRSVWYKSLLELLVKFIILALVGTFMAIHLDS